MKRLLALACALCLCLTPLSALALTGQSFDTFEQYYGENITFINENDNRHLMAMVIAKSTSETQENHYEYKLTGDVLNLTVVTDSSGVIESCLITVTAPSGMEYGNAIYNDFAISGYHSYALLMAMDASADPQTRYTLVSNVVEGMRTNNGDYTQQVGVYTLTCERVNNVAILEFRNNGVAEPTPTPEETAAPDPNASPDPNGGEYIG